MALEDSPTDLDDNVRCGAGSRVGFAALPSDAGGWPRAWLGLCCNGWNVLDRSHSVAMTLPLEVMKYEQRSRSDVNGRTIK